MSEQHDYVPILSVEERERFANYLERRVSDSEGLLKQLLALPNGAAMANVLKTEIVAQKIVARMLRGITMGTT